MYTFYFEKLEVCQNARKFVKEIYRAIDVFPQKEQFAPFTVPIFY